jgi:predicted AAA+ superfamily ATPase
VPVPEYRPRVVDAEMTAALSSIGAVLVEGPKAVGKTFTATQFARSDVRLDVDERAREGARLDPSLVLAGASPRLIDEWQLLPAIWDHVRRAVDDRAENGLFILTGSAIPPDDATRHVGAGRFLRLRMRPMTVWEAGRSMASVSFAETMNGKPARAGDSELTIPNVAELVARGGWPRSVDFEPPAALRLVRGYIDEIARADVSRASGGRQRDSRLVERILRSYARHVGTPAAVTTITADVNGDEGRHNQETIAEYIETLARLMIVEEVGAWDPNLRSRARLRTRSVRMFVDPSIAVAALGANADALLRDPNTFGLLFENLVIRDLRVYAQALDARVFHYRDNTDLEADAIVERPDGRWAAFEVKLGQHQIEEAARNLRTLADERIDTSKAGPPLALGVITGTGYAYVRGDGVSVIPIGALSP